jgi:hypothetical protein
MVQFKCHKLHSLYSLHLHVSYFIVNLISYIKSYLKSFSYLSTIILILADVYLKLMWIALCDDFNKLFIFFYKNRKIQYLYAWKNFLIWFFSFNIFAVFSVVYTTINSCMSFKNALSNFSWLKLKLLNIKNEHLSYFYFLSGNIVWRWDEKINKLFLFKCPRKFKIFDTHIVVCN